jgi:hypothetical protein
MRSASEKAATVSALRNDGKQMELRAGAKKTLKLTVECLRCSRFAPRSLFNCGIRVEPQRPFGRKDWQDNVAAKFGLRSTLRPVKMALWLAKRSRSDFESHSISAKEIV